MQLESVLASAPPPASVAELIVTVQLLNVHASTAPPSESDEFPDNAQLPNTDASAPPPMLPAEFWKSSQFCSNPCQAPPPVTAELAVSQQLLTSVLVSWHQTPPPLCSVFGSPVVRVAPPRRLNPLRMALLMIHAHRTAESPMIGLPRMVVTAGPFMLMTSIGRFMTSRLDNAPAKTRPP